MSTNWTAIEAAVRSWAKSASGLDDAHVIWDVPNATRPASGMFITLRMGEMLAVGTDEMTGTDTPGGGTPGQSDYTITVTGRREFSVTVQCYAPPVAPYLGPPHGSGSAFAVLSRLQTALGLPSVRATFQAAGISCFDRASVSYVPEIKGTVFEGRAVLVPRFNAFETVSETTTYIEAVTPVGFTFNP